MSWKEVKYGIVQLLIIHPDNETVPFSINIQQRLFQMNLDTQLFWQAA